MIKLFIKEIVERFTQENFDKIQKFFNEDPFIKGHFKHFEITFTQAETNFKFPHQLGFQPKDVIQTSLTGAGSLTWNYSSINWDATNLDITVTDACVVRAYIGRYAENRL